MTKQYARLFDRVKAAFIDAIVLLGMMYAASELFALFDNVPVFVRIIAAAFIFFLYDPIFTSFYGGTIGHSFCKLGVRKDKALDANISFASAIIRFILKFFLGWISLLTITGNDKKKAIHDFVAKSVVIELPDE